VVRNLRASDEDRERTVAELANHLLAGRLTLEEFTDRIELAYTAKLEADLEAVQADLPASAAAQLAQWRTPMRCTAAFFAHVVRRGRMRLRGWTLVGCAFGSVDLDLRDAAFDVAVTRLNVVTIFGNVDIYVPADVNVESGGLALFGSRRHWGADLARPEDPAIRVRAIGLVGTIDTWSIPTGSRGTYGDLMRAATDVHRLRPP
jgi:DUF1707 SHOCT-like domain